MSFRFDFAALDRSGRPLVVIEAKAIRNVDEVWARESRSMIDARAPELRSSEFLLITPDYFFRWPASAKLDSAPDVIDARNVLEPYMQRIGLAADQRIDPLVFEDIVEWWLHDIATGVVPPPTFKALESVTTTLRDARVVSQYAA